MTIRNLTTSAGERIGPTRRGMLSIIPAALFAGWRGLSGPPKTGASSDQAPSPRPQTARNQQVSTYYYSYAAYSADGDARYDDAIHSTVSYYDEDGRLIAHRVLPAKEPSARNQPGCTYADAQGAKTMRP